ncbi:phospho-N-acetylmuramoyl-pentapeptide-transferase [Spirochaeta lutea]|uniref:Phospho-N-acetylmuramoyl-pentapeptide-transferase n=1 Tax=Spirochaeta lutea TaxID=1480694 RepID=A0A098R0M5_9SPIO|nr:phospho-N-acetylmuramoyl-pentapeptide-transferase [Spirochaeta lutea]KGE73509.1 phospho-N-acetylmuramoyl-pentapeptide-transferase [Spirochaeta lutea]
MFKVLLYPLVEYFTPFNVFQYITFRAAYAAVTSLLLTLLLGPRVIRMLERWKIGEGIRSDGPQSHQKKTGTPTMGGLLLVFSTAFSVFLWMDISNLYTWISLVAILGFGAVGFADDYIKVFLNNKQGLPSRVKMLGLLVVSTVIMVMLYHSPVEYTTKLFIPMVKGAVLDLGVFFIPFGIFILVATSNAVNLTDGLDGLATGLTIMVGLTFAALAYLTGRVDFSEYLQIPYLRGAGEISILSFALVGACVGFLWFNSNPAEVFMGDTGSLMLGGVVGAISLMIKKELLLVIVGGVFVIEVLSVIIQVVSFKIRKKRVFLMAPLHHHFELKGWAENKVVLRFWILGGLFAILSLSTLKIR